MIKKIQNLYLQPKIMKQSASNILAVVIGIGMSL